jgi:hypothetical protein
LGQPYKHLVRVVKLKVNLTKIVIKIDFLALRQCVAVRGSMRQYGSVRHCEQQCVAVHTVVCGSAHGSV